MSRPRALVVGATGLLGRKVLGAFDKTWAVASATRAGLSVAGESAYILDLTQRGAVKAALQDAKPDLVVNAAAMTNVDACETDRRGAWAVNVWGVETLAEAALAVGARLIHVSTDYVFDGDAGPYPEEAAPRPLNWYGATKAGGERAVLANSQHMVVRTIVLYGHAPGARPNFVSWLWRELREGRRVRAATDQWGNPTLADDLAAALRGLTEAGASGLVHYGGSSFLTRYEMALAVADALGAPAELIAPVTTCKLGQRALRPLRSGLVTERAGVALGRVPVDFTDGLRTALAHLDSG